MKLARRMERREDVGQESAGSKVRMEKEGAEEESRVKGEKRELERREREGSRKMEESTIGNWKAAEVKKERREETEEGESARDGGRRERWREGENARRETEREGKEKI